MKKIICLFLLVPTLCFADITIVRQVPSGKIIEMQSNPRPGTLMQNAVNSGYDIADVEEVMMTMAEYQSAMDARWAEDVPSARIKKMSAIRSQATALSAQYPPVFWNQGADFQTALTNTVNTAATEIEALNDIATIKTYQPSWPSAPSH